MDKKIYLAPLEGITDSIYRNTFAEFYGGVDKYYTPFLSPNSTKKFTTKEFNNVNPENNDIGTTVPQLLTNSSEHFLWAVGQLADMGYREINFNLGCPSGTVVAKKKGSGMLFHPELLDRVLYEIFDGIEKINITNINNNCSINKGSNDSSNHISISIKTRLGKNDPDEFYEILDIYNKYPISELTLHPRIQTDFYKEPVRKEFFDYAASHAKMPLVFNGDLKSAEDIENCYEKYPNINAVMLGRGLIAQPWLANSCRDSICKNKINVSELNLPKVSENKTNCDESSNKSMIVINYDKFWQFHDSLLEQYKELLSGETPLLHRLKEFWVYWQENFPGNDKIIKEIRKTKRLASYDSIIGTLR